MRHIIITAFISLLTFGVQAQTNYDAQTEMQEDMRVIVNTLKMDAEQIFKLGPVMEERKETKSKLAGQIKAVNERKSLLDSGMNEQVVQLDKMVDDYRLQMAEADKASFAKVEAILIGRQKERFSDEVKPQLAEANKKRMTENPAAK